MILGVILLSLCKNVGTIFYMVITKSYIGTRNWYHINILKRNRIKIKHRHNRPQSTTQVLINETQKCDANFKDSSSNSHSSKSTENRQISKPYRLSKRRKTVEVLDEIKGMFEEPRSLDNKKPKNELIKGTNQSIRNRRRNTFQVSSLIY